MKRDITNGISRIFGGFASYKFPKAVQVFINKAYVFLMKVDMSDYDDIKTFASLNALFTRKLKKERVLEGDKRDFISPCDGVISEQGVVENEKALQIKGSSYSVSKLLGDFVCKKDKTKLVNGSFINLYLSPRDYHRFHAPCQMRVLRAIQISGKLYPVNFTYLRKINSLFCENERVILVCEGEDKKRFYLVFVGALNVGKIAFVFDEKIATNAKANGEVFYDYENLVFQKGDELGRFEMGSTIVVLFEDNQMELSRSNEKVKYGESIARFT